MSHICDVCGTSLDTAGNCPNGECLGKKAMINIQPYDPYDATNNPPLGWICPVCGAGRSPFVEFCPCTPCIPPTTTGNTTKPYGQ